MMFKIQKDQGPNNWSVAQAVAILVAVATSLILLALVFYWGIPAETVTNEDGTTSDVARDLPSARIALLILLGVWAHVLAQFAMSRTNRSRTLDES